LVEADLRAETVNLVFSWFALGNFYIAFVVLTVSRLAVPISEPLLRPLYTFRYQC
jgi:hypothetical protein